MRKIKSRRYRYEILAQRSAGLTSRHEPTQSPKPGGNWKLTKTQRKAMKKASKGQQLSMLQKGEKTKPSMLDKILSKFGV